MVNDNDIDDDWLNDDVDGDGQMMCIMIALMTSMIMSVLNNIY